MPYLAIFILRGCQDVHLHFFLSIAYLEHVTWSNSIHMSLINGIKLPLQMTLQWFDSPHYITFIAWLVTRLNASMLLFTKALVLRCPSRCSPFTLVWSFKAAIFHPFKPSQVRQWFESTLSIHWNPYNEIHLRHYWFPWVTSLIETIPYARYYVSDNPQSISSFNNSICIVVFWLN